MVWWARALHPCREDTLHLLRCGKWASQHAGFQGDELPISLGIPVGKEYVTLYYITKMPWLSRLYPAGSFSNRRGAKHLAPHFCFTFVVSGCSCGRISVRFETVTALTWLSDTKHHESHSGRVRELGSQQRKDDLEHEIMR